jgi:hypothetical protein
VIWRGCTNPCTVVPRLQTDKTCVTRGSRVVKCILRMSHHHGPMSLKNETMTFAEYAASERLKEDSMYAPRLGL